MDIRDVKMFGLGFTLDMTKEKAVKALERAQAALGDITRDDTIRSATISLMDDDFDKDNLIRVAVRVRGTNEDVAESLVTKIVTESRSIFLDESRLS